MAHTAVTRLAAAVAECKGRSDDIRVVFTPADARALLAIIADLCDDHVSCESCQIDLCDTCVIGEYGPCDHFTICDTCYYEHYCRDCAEEDRRFDLADQARAYAKEGL